ncbi:MAG: hypothetical protein JXR51_06415 [Bacteroidales bacterium]|nr:hypothetical protein [Bacteroidales bacterium]MBN2756795.1 hypothetical protein [Bacteroidales bacterium]
MNNNNLSENKLKGSYFSIVISISLVIFMLGLISLLIVNAKRLSDYAKENIGFSIILHDDEMEMDIIKLQKELDLADFVIETKFITKEEAAESLKENLGEDFIDFLGFNPLLASIDVRLKAEYANKDSILLIEKNLKKNPLVKEVSYQKSLVSVVNENVRKISFVLLAFSLMFFLISFALINNTIRLSFYSKRFIINTMQLVGATKNFIRKPFLKQAVFLGFLGALISILLMIFSIYFLQNTLEDIIIIYDKWLIFIIMLILGVIISSLSTYFAVNRFLRLKSDELFY